jgi:CO dehydrogenase maturation factor
MRLENTIGQLREDMLRNADDLPTSMSKPEYVRYQIRLALQEGDRFDMLTMGRSEGPGCYCYINSILRTFLDSMMDDYPFVVIDNEAGMEHLSRRTTRRMDLLLVVSDATRTGVETAVRIRDLAREMEVEVIREVLVINRSPKELHPAVKQTIASSGFQEVIHIPEDRRVKELAIVGEPLASLDQTSPAYRVLRGLVSRLT